MGAQIRARGWPKRYRVAPRLVIRFGRVVRSASAVDGKNAQMAAVHRWLNRRGQIDPELPFEVGRMNGPQARESDLQLKASVAPIAVAARCSAVAHSSTGQPKGSFG